MKNFGLIQTIFDGLMIDGLVAENKQKKALYSNFVKRIKNNKIMKTQFEVYSLLENANTIEDEDLNYYIKETISLLDNFSREDIIKENLNTFKPILEKMPELEFRDYPNKNIHEAISELIFTKKTTKTINSILKNTNIIKENLIANKSIQPLINEESDSKIIPNSTLKKLMIEQFNKKYSSFNSVERLTFMSLIKEDVELQEETFKFITKECINRVNRKLETDLEIKETLLKVKEKLLTNEFTNENYQTNIIQLVDLYNDLE